MTDEAIRAFWGDDRLVRWPPASLDFLPISAESKQFLASVGLPNDPDFSVLFVPAPHVGPFPGHSAHRMPIGHLDQLPSKQFCIDGERQGAVLEVDVLGNVGGCFVNTGVEQLARFVTLLAMLRNDAASADDRRLALRLEETLCQMRLIDPQAMSEASHWWPSYFEEERSYLNL